MVKVMPTDPAHEPLNRHEYVFESYAARVKAMYASKAFQAAMSQRSVKIEEDLLEQYGIYLGMIGVVDVECLEDGSFNGRGVKFRNSIMARLMMHELHLSFQVLHQKVTTRNLMS